MSHPLLKWLLPCLLLWATPARAQSPAASASSAEAAAPAASSAVAPAPPPPAAASNLPATPPTPVVSSNAADAGIAEAPDAAADTSPEVAPDASPDRSSDALPDAEPIDVVEAAVEAEAAAPAVSAPALVPPRPSVSPAPPPAAEPAAVPKGPEPPPWNIFPVLAEGGDDGGWVEQLLPDLGLGDRGNLLGFAFLLALSALIANVAGKIRRRLPVRGVLPRTIAAIHVGTRAAVALLFVVLVASWIPSAYAPVLLWVALAAAAAAGWSARDFLPDLFAGVVLFIERRVRPGTWVTGNGFAGEIETTGLRAARLRDVDGRGVSVPNRKLLGGPVAIDTSRQPKIEVVIRVPSGTLATTARQAIEDAALLSPWRVLRDRPEVRRDANDPRTWRVRLRLIEPRFARAFESALVDHIEEMLGAARQ
jgi:hypothetical protein